MKTLGLYQETLSRALVILGVFLLFFYSATAYDSYARRVGMLLPIRRR